MAAGADTCGGLEARVNRGHEPIEREARLAGRRRQCLTPSPYRRGDIFTRRPPPPVSDAEPVQKRRYLYSPAAAASV